MFASTCVFNGCLSHISPGSSWRGYIPTGRSYWSVTYTRMYSRTQTATQSYTYTCLNWPGIFCLSQQTQTIAKQHSSPFIRHRENDIDAIIHVFFFYSVFFSSHQWLTLILFFSCTYLSLALLSSFFLLKQEPFFTIWHVPKCLLYPAGFLTNVPVIFFLCQRCDLGLSDVKRASLLQKRCLLLTIWGDKPGGAAGSFTVTHLDGVIGEKPFNSTGLKKHRLSGQMVIEI